MILLVDNNDSFTHNVVELLRRITTKRVDVINSTVLEINQVSNYQHIILSPGPSLPEDYPILFDIIDQFMGKIPILGICLGHQTICRYFGEQLRNYIQPFHGNKSTINCNPNSVLFRDKSTMEVGRYHSWVADKAPVWFEVVATDAKGDIMAIESTKLKLYGVQFHPESYITEDGESILRNFLNETIE